MQSNAFTQLPAGTTLAGTSLKTETQQQLSELMADAGWQSPAKDTTNPAKAAPGRVVVFCGTDGDAHLQAAAAIAIEMNSPVYRVHLSAVVSKYILETEKNMDRLFKKAANNKALLFFDEADTLFAKRTEVGNAHDRYANQEANYLLQQAAALGVVVILSVKRKENIDNAFLRRLRFIVQF